MTGYDLAFFSASNLSSDDFLKQFHDKNVVKNAYAENMMRKINEAYTVLSNPVKRSEYDLKLAVEVYSSNNFVVVPNKEIVSTVDIKFDLFKILFTTSSIVFIFFSSGALNNLENMLVNDIPGLIVSGLFLVFILLYFLKLFGASLNWIINGKWVGLVAAKKWFWEDGYLYFYGVLFLDTVIILYWIVKLITDNSGFLLFGFATILRLIVNYKYILLLRIKLVMKFIKFF